MKDLLNSIGIFISWILTDMIPKVANATLGALGELFTSIDSLKVTIPIILGAITFLGRKAIKWSKHHL